MEKKSSNFSMQDAMRMANSDAGKQLLQLLQRQNSPAISQAMEQASKGDYTNLSKTLAPLLESSDIQRLLKQMGGK